MSLLKAYFNDDRTKLLNTSKTLSNACNPVIGLVGWSGSIGYVFPKLQKVNRPLMDRGISILSVKSEDNPDAEKEQLQAAEERAQGNLKWSVVRKYLKSVDSWILILLTVVAVLVAQGAATATDYWISFW